MQADEKINFTARDICRILESCKVTGVREFIFGDLHFEFRGDESPCDIFVEAPVPLTTMPSKDLIDHDKQSIAALQLDEMRERESRLAHLLVEDPEEYERQIAHGELFEDDESDGEETE